MELKRINDDVSVAPQISPDDMPAVKSAGFTTVINNRPDGEAFDQPRTPIYAIAGPLEFRLRTVSTLSTSTEFRA